MAHSEDPAEQSLSLWHQNHGNLLALLVFLIVAIGSVILAYEQNRFVPPRFPPERAIDNPEIPVEQETTGQGITDSPPVSPDSPVPPEGGAAGREEAGIPLTPPTTLIRVTGASSRRGRIAIAIYDSVSNFNDPAKAIATSFRPINDGSATWKLETSSLPNEFAIAAFHDENSDGELARNVLGIPTERYGYTNDARGLTGPPHFKQAVIQGPFDGKAINVEIR